MSTTDNDDFEKYITVPPLEDTDSLPVIVQHISKISDAIDKCEKMLQHLALGTYSDEFQKYMSDHIHLISMRNQLYTKMKKLKSVNNPPSKP